MPLLIHSLVQLLCVEFQLSLKRDRVGKDSCFMAVLYDVTILFTDVPNIFYGIIELMLSNRWRKHTSTLLEGLFDCVRLVMS